MRRISSFWLRDTLFSLLVTILGLEASAITGGVFSVPKIIEQVIRIESMTTCLGVKDPAVLKYKAVYLPECIYT